MIKAPLWIDSLFFTFAPSILFFFFVWRGIHLLSASNAGSGGVKPTSKIVIQTVCGAPLEVLRDPSRCPICEAR